MVNLSNQLGFFNSNSFFMPVKYRIIGRGKPGEPDSKKKYYAAPIATGETTLEDLTDRVEEICTAHGADIRAVIFAMQEVLVSQLEDGKIVRIGELGSIRVSFSSVGEESEEKVSSSSIKCAKAIFHPGKRLKQSLKHLKYKKA